MQIKTSSTLQFENVLKITHDDDDNKNMMKLMSNDQIWNIIDLFEMKIKKNVVEKKILK